MKLTLLQENLSLALSHVSRFSALKGQLPILSHILFTTDAGRLKITATNLELGINYWIGAKIDSDGSFTVPSKDIAEFVSYLPAGHLDLELSQNLLTVSSSKAKSTFSTSTATDFPALPSLDSKTSIALDTQVLVNLIDQVAFSAATDDTRPILTSVLCHFTADTLKFVATDGFRLSLKEIKLDNPLKLPDGQDSLTFLVPARSLQEITKLSQTNKTLTFGPSLDSHQLVFVLEDVELVSRLLEGDFPDYQRIIPDSYQTKVFVNRDELAKAIKIASVFARQSANVIKLNLKSSHLEISASTPQIGQNSVSVDARLEGPALEIAFNYKFITDLLAVAKGEEITLNFNEPLTPVLFHDPTNPAFTHIIMPVRIQD